MRPVHTKPVCYRDSASDAGLSPLGATLKDRVGGAEVGVGSMFGAYLHYVIGNTPARASTASLPQFAAKDPDYLITVM